MKTTVFTKYHIAAGAKMAEFAGYNMPIEFTGINDEHMAVRNGAGVFDVSHMGEIWVKGPRALDLLQRITTNDVSKLFDGKVQYTCMPNGRGGIVDDILVYRVDAETYMLCVNAANIDKDWKHICAEGKAFGMEAGHGAAPSSKARGLRTFFANVVRCEPDKQGRFLLPDDLRKYAGIQQEVYFLGQAGRAEIWAAERYEEEEANVSAEELAALMEEIGI